MSKSLLRSYPKVLIIHKHFLNKVNRFIRCKMLVICCYKAFKRLRWLSVQLLLKESVECQVIFPHVLKEIISAKHLRNFEQLVLIVIPLKERILLEYNFSHGAASRPNVE